MEQQIASKPEQLESQVQIVITVGDPEPHLEYGGVKQYYTYTLKGKDSKGEIDIHRRYSEFESFRYTLVKKWPGICIPSLPSRIKLTNSDSQFLELRSNLLQKFLTSLATKKYIWYSEETQFFLKNKQLNCQRVMASHLKFDLSQILYRYKTNFGQLEANEDENVLTTINQFDKQLKILLAKAQQFRNKAQDFVKAQTKYQSKYSKGLLQILTRYEQKCLTSQFQPPQDEKEVKIFNQTNCATKKEAVQDYLQDTSSKVFFEEIKREKRQIMAFEAALKERDQYLKQKAKLQQKIRGHENKISDIVNGKQSLLAKMRKSSAQVQIQSQQNVIDKYKKQLQDYNLLCKLLDLVVLKQIELFKQDRIGSYYAMIRDIIKLELQLANKEKDFWKAVSSQNQFIYQIQEAMKIKNFSSPQKEEKKHEEKQGSSDKKISKEEVDNFLEKDDEVDNEQVYKQQSADRTHEKVNGGKGVQEQVEQVPPTSVQAVVVVKTTVEQNGMKTVTEQVTTVSTQVKEQSNKDENEKTLQTANISKETAKQENQVEEMVVKVNGIPQEIVETNLAPTTQKETSNQGQKQVEAAQKQEQPEIRQKEEPLGRAQKEELVTDSKEEPEKQIVSIEKQQVPKAEPEQVRNELVQQKDQPVKVLQIATDPKKEEDIVQKEAEEAGEAKKQEGTE